MDQTDLNLDDDLPGPFSISGRRRAQPPMAKVNEVSTRLVLVDQGHARRAGVALHGSVQAMQEIAQDAHEATIEKYFDKLDQCKYNGKRRCQSPLGLRPYDDDKENPHRHVAIVRVPWLDEASDQAVFGFTCPLCDYGAPENYVQYGAI